MFALQPFNQCLLGAVCKYSTNDADIEEFYLLDASDCDQVKTNLISRVDVIEWSNKNHDDNDFAISHMDNFLLDWETDLMNQLENQQRPIRAYVNANMRKFYGYCGERACLMWKGVSEFNANDLNIYTNIHGHQVIGFVGGFMLMVQFDIKLEKSSTVDSLNLEPCPEVNFTLRETNAIIMPSGPNILKKDYALTGLLSGKLLYLFDLNEKKFVKSFNFVPYDNTFSLDGSFTFIPYLEGNRLRSFLLQNKRLYEFVWKGEEFNSDIEMIRHLEWIDIVYSVCRIDNCGLLFQYHNEKRFVHSVYKPQPFNSKHSKNEGIIIEVPTSKTQQNLHYSPKSKCIINLEGKTISRVATLDEINQLPSHKVEEIFNEEEYLEKLKIDTSFKTYQPRLITDACEIITNIPNNPRITQAYQIKEGCYDQIEIVAGINCKKIKNLAEIVAEDYVELKPEDFADYLGAPIIKGVLPYGAEYGSFIKDMYNLNRSSKTIEIFDVRNSCCGKERMSLDKMEKNRFIGILSCKPKSDDMDDDDDDEWEDVDDEDEEEEKEFEIMFQRNEFKVESNKLIVTDPFTEDSGVIINKVRPGVWKWITTSKSKDYVDGESHNQNLIAQLAAIHEDYYKDLENSKLWKVPDNVYRKLDRNQKVERNEYFEDEIEGGWCVMKLGVGVDVSVAGIFDQKYFNDEKCLELKPVKMSLLEELIFSPNSRSEWQNYFSEKMEEDEYPSTMAAPYGIITRSGDGDGCYPCLFKKSKSGDVIAVRIIYC